MQQKAAVLLQTAALSSQGMSLTFIYILKRKLPIHFAIGLSPRTKSAV